jgi:glycosyltransferase involved in cell wall biosynthesis
MRVVHLNATDAGGGAARSALRLHLALRDTGVDSQLFVRRATSGADGVVEHRSALDARQPLLRARLDSLPSRVYLRRRASQLFTVDAVPDRIIPALAVLEPDIVNIHWIGRGFMQIESIAGLPGKIVWTLHDSWAFTGGCHVPHECQRFSKQCGACPALGSHRERDLSRWVWNRKYKSFHGTRLTIVAPSQWMREQALSSSLFRSSRIEHIPNGVDTRTFRPLESRAAKAKLSIPSEAPTVLFAAMWAERDPNKGFHLLARALCNLLLFDRTRPHLLVAGSSTLHRDPSLKGLPASTVGEITTEAHMADVIAAADVVAIPSMQENFPNSALEALACGRPVVAFDVGGIPDLVKNNENGLLAPAFDTARFGECIATLLSDPGRADALGRAASRRVEQTLTVGTQARRYEELYRSLLDE